MGKVKFCVLVWFLTALLGVAFVGESQALTLFDDKLAITGWIKNETAVRLEDRVWYDPATALPDTLGGTVKNAELDRGQLSRCRTMFQLEADWSLTPQLRLSTLVHAYYEAKYDLDKKMPEDSVAFKDDDWMSGTFAAGDIDSWDALGRGGRNMREDFEFKEFNLTYESGPFIIKAGRQQIMWGEADYLRMADIINPLDLSWKYVMAANWEEIRIPLRMINITYIVPESKYNFRVEVVLNPEDFRPHSQAPYGDQWYSQGDRVFGRPLWRAVYPTVQSVGSAVALAEKRGLPDKHSLRNFQGGVRLRGQFGAWEVFLYDFYQRRQQSVITSSQSDATTPLPVLNLNPFNPADPDTFGLRAHYPYINTIGATFNVYSSKTGTVFRGECGYVPDMPYSVFRNWTLSAFGDDFPTPLFDTCYTEKDTFSYMLGFDRPTWIRWLNSSRTVFITAQLFQSFVFNLSEHDQALTLMGKDNYQDHMTTLTTMINTEYCDAKILPQIVAVWEGEAKSGFVMPQIAYEPNFSWRFELGAMFFYGDSYNAGYWGAVKDNDEVWFLVQYKF